MRFKTARARLDALQSLVAAQHPRHHSIARRRRHTHRSTFETRLARSTPLTASATVGELSKPCELFYGFSQIHRRFRAARTYAHVRSGLPLRVLHAPTFCTDAFPSFCWVTGCETITPRALHTHLLRLLSLTLLHLINERERGGLPAPSPLALGV